MHMKKTILAIAIGVAAQGVSAYETDYGNVMADIKLRYEYADIDDATDSATGVIADAAIGFETKDYEGFKVLIEQEIVAAPIARARMVFFMCMAISCNQAVLFNKLTLFSRHFQPAVSCLKIGKSGDV